MEHELFNHGADIGIRGEGKNMSMAFENAGIALTSVVTDPNKVSQESVLQLRLDEKDPELLFLDWINTLIYEMDTKQMLFAFFNVSIKEGHLEAEIKGEKVNRPKHDPAVEVKGATLTELKVTKQNGHWIAQCVVDV